MLGFVRRALSPFVDALRVARLGRRFPSCRIESAIVSPSARLGDSVRIARGVEVRGNVSMGRWTYVEPFTFINGADIGSFCSIGRNVAIGGFQHPYRYPTTSPRLYREILGCRYEDPARSTRIGNDVWIGDEIVLRHLRKDVDCRGDIGLCATVASALPSALD